MSFIRTLAAGLLLAVLTLASLAGPASAATSRHHHTPQPCTVRDYGNIRTEPSGKSWICQPAGHGRYTWQLITARIEN
jgi:hypothetical protein